MSNNGFVSYGSVSAVGGAIGSNDQPFQGGAAPATKAPRSRVRIQDIIPCCVNQLLTSTLVDNVFKIRGIQVSQASVVGIIRKVERASNYILYRIDDMTTKPIEVRQWLGRNKAKQGMSLLPVGVYVKVIGILKCFEEVKGLEVLNIRVLEDMNEFTTHILETVNAHMMLDKAHQVASGPSEPVVPSKIDEVQKHGEYHHLDFIHKEVLRLIHECPRQEGKSVHELQTQLHSLSDRAIKQALEYLIVEGYIYPTVDEEHFKSAD
ncbi:replication protein A 30 kDa subunit [Ursus maritimus]|uniref:Replication protein A 30 kDa subunit n=1 Tax=Ursus maritimus TaxID=29073 RepID=A0A384CYT4_URSMA|nr:replication protein A 30 kDa subunit [Ursus maritimus]XP_048069368.1 replication protein A 30 kDa subunit [Ursus arctos]